MTTKTNEHERLPSESFGLNFSTSEILSFEVDSTSDVSQTKKEKNNNTKPHRQHYKQTASHSLTVGGYGLYNEWNDGDVTASEDPDDSASFTGGTPQPTEIDVLKQQMKYDNIYPNTTNVNNHTEKQTPKTVPIIPTNNTNIIENALETQIVLATVKQKNKENKNKNKNKNHCHTILHYLGLLAFSHSILNDANIKRFHNLLNVFSETRFYIHEYYFRDDVPTDITDKILTQIESFIISPEQKAKKLSNCWYDLVDKECLKNLFIFPFLFGWIELVLMLYINILFILIIFNYENQFHFKNKLYNLSLLLLIIVGLHCVGIVYQMVLCRNKKLIQTLKKYKKRFVVSDLDYRNDLKEKYISLQKWFNCIIVTGDKNYKGYFMEFFIEKYLFLLLIGVGLFCVLHLLNWNQNNIANKVEKLYIIFQLIILPLWWICVVFGIKKCLNFIISNKKYFIVLLLYFVLFLIVCIHSYSRIKFLDKMKFLDDDHFVSKIIFFAFLIFFNPFLLFFLFCKLKITLENNKYSKYYVTNLLMIYLCVTIKIFIDKNIIKNSPATLELIQNILNIVIYCLISISNVIYLSAIHVKYFKDNGIVIVRRWIFSFWTVFLSNYKVENFCYETEWNFDKHMAEPVKNFSTDIDDELSAIHSYNVAANEINDVNDDIDFGQMNNDIECMIVKEDTKEDKKEDNDNDVNGDMDYL